MSMGQKIQKKDNKKEENSSSAIEVKESEWDINLIYFSPTHGTKKIVSKLYDVIERKLKEKLGAFQTNIKIKKNIINLASFDVRNSIESFEQGDDGQNKVYISPKTILNIVGTPIYEGRVPKIVRNVLKKLEGNNTPAIAVNIYGNRLIGKALRELSTILNGSGFIVIGAGTFIGEHSFSNQRLKIANGRPNNMDLKMAEEFGDKIAELIIEKYSSTKGIDLNIMPKFDNIFNSIIKKIPGRESFFLRFVPEGFSYYFAYPQKIPEDTCTQCGVCVKNCPTRSIDPETYKVDLKSCIRCMACVKYCPEHARPIKFRLYPFFKMFMRPAIKKENTPQYMIFYENDEK
ncbi:MAG: 4Fe-4S binding protein [Promethearchaeota archaeon]